MARAVLSMAWLTTAVATGICAPLAMAQPSPPASPPATSPSESPEQAARRDLDHQADLLLGADTPPDQREQAAARLVMGRQPAARGILLRALADKDNRAISTAAANALAGDPNPALEFVAPLVALLPRDFATAKAAANALTGYAQNAEVLAQLIQFAADHRQPRRSRALVVGALGAFVKKNAAGALVRLLSDDSDESLVRDAAADALVRMTGRRDLGDDPAQWSAWWKTTATLPDRDWELTQYQNRSAVTALVDREFQRLSAHVKELLDRDYQRAPKEQRSDLLLAWLHDGEPVIRSLAADKVFDEKINGNVIATPVLEQLRGMIADSDADVRKAVIVALKAVNDAPSVDPLLTQLSRETDPAVKVAIAQALGVLKKLKSVDALLALLNGPPTRAGDAVAEAAAEALDALGEQIRDDPAMRVRVSVNLRIKLESTAARFGTENLRAALLEALAPLRDPNLLRVFIIALDAADPQAVKIRIAACKGLGNMTTRDDMDAAAGALVGALRHDSAPSVQLEAARALEKVGTLPRADALYEQLNPRGGASDASVREACWTALVAILQREASADVLLGTWQERFRDDPSIRNDLKKRAAMIQRRLVILKLARDRLIIDAPKNPQADRKLAGVQQNIGEAHLALAQWGEAAASFRASMTYWQAHGAQPHIIAQLSEQLVEALLRAGSYSEAVQFASERIAASPQESGDMGHRIRSEVERLRDSKKPEDWKSALQLIEEASKMRPPLSDPYAEPMQRYKTELQVRIKS